MQANNLFSTSHSLHFPLMFGGFFSVVYCLSLIADIFLSSNDAPHSLNAHRCNGSESPPTWLTAGWPPADARLCDRNDLCTNSSNERILNGLVDLALFLSHWKRSYFWSIFWSSWWAPVMISAALDVVTAWTGQKIMARTNEIPLQQKGHEADRLEQSAKQLLVHN